MNELAYVYQWLSVCFLRYIFTPSSTFSLFTLACAQSYLVTPDLTRMVSQPKATGHTISVSTLSPTITIFYTGPQSYQSCCCAKAKALGCGLPQVYIQRSTPQTSLQTVLRPQLKGFMRRRGRLWWTLTVKRSLQHVMTGTCCAGVRYWCSRDTWPSWVLKQSMITWYDCYQLLGVVRIITAPICSSCFSSTPTPSRYFTRSTASPLCYGLCCTASGTDSGKTLQYSSVVMYFQRWGRGSTSFSRTSRPTISTTPSLNCCSFPLMGVQLRMTCLSSRGVSRLSSWDTS